MANNSETITLEELGVEIPAEGYNVGYGAGPPQSYAELLANAFRETDDRITGITKAGIDKQTATFDEVNGIVSANAQPGATLDVKFQNALNELHHDGGRIVVAPPTDGSVWRWANNVEVIADDPGAGTGGGYHFDFAPGTRIMFTGGTNPLTINHPSGSRQRKDVTLTGGFWSGANASNPDGCFHVKSAADTTISAEHIAQFSNSAGDSYGIKFSNYDRFCEKYAVTGFRITGCDVCVDFEPESYLDNQGINATGSGSFVDGTITNMAFTPHEYGIRIRGQHAANVFQNIAFFPASANATAWLIDGSMARCTVPGARFDNPGGTSGMTGIETGPNYNNDEPPFFFGPYFAHVADNVIRNSTSHFLPAMWTDFGYWHIGDLGESGTSLRIRQDGVVNVQGTFEIENQRIRPPSGVSVAQGANQSLSSGYEKLTMATVAAGDSSLFNDGNDTVTVPPGSYIITCQVRFNGTAAGDSIRFGVYNQTANTGMGNVSATAAGDPATRETTYIRDFDAETTVYLQAATGGSNVTTGSASTHFAIHAL